jgi:predicted amidohydrolase YtcJ
VKEFPTKEMLDKVFPDNPVYLIRIDGHAALVNSEALRRAKITTHTIVEGGEVIVRTGEPTGVLIDKAMTLVSDLIPEPDDTFYRKALLLAQERCFAVGLTSVADAGLSKQMVELIEFHAQRRFFKNEDLRHVGSFGRQHGALCEKRPVSNRSAYSSVN